MEQSALSDLVLELRHVGLGASEVTSGVLEWEFYSRGALPVSRPVLDQFMLYGQFLRWSLDVALG